MIKGRRKYKIADVILCLKSDIPFEKNTYHSRFQNFLFEGKTEDEVNIYLSHRGIPKLKIQNKKIYQKPPWRIFKINGKITYEMFVEGEEKTPLIAIFSRNYNTGYVYRGKDYVEIFKEGTLRSLLSLTTDRVFFPQMLIRRRGIFIHASGLIWNHQGHTFIGHSNQGKSTIVKLFFNEAKVLNDECMILREKNHDFWLYSNPWSAEIEQPPSDSAPLGAIFFLHKSKKNYLRSMSKSEAALRLFEHTVRPLMDRIWIKNTLKLCDEIAEKIPCYHLYFKKDKSVVEFLKRRVFEKK